MTLQPTTAEEIASVCADLAARGPYPPALAQKLAANDPEGLRLALSHLIEIGRRDGLRALIDRLRERRDFAVWARTQSARLHRLTGNDAAALADIDDLMGNFAPRAHAGWWIVRARALLGLGRNEEAEQTLQEGLARYPDEPALSATLALAAEDRGQWTRALASWDAYAIRIGPPGDAQLATGRARALFRLDRVDEATQALDELLAREPDNAQGLRELAVIHSELGETARARDLRVRLLQRHPDNARPEWWVALARSHHDLDEDDAAAAALAELERRFPQSALAATERLRIAKKRETGQDAMMALVEAARARFPRDHELRSYWVWLLLSFGRLDDAAREVEALEADGGAGFALEARLRLEADRGDENLRGFLARWGEGHKFGAGETSQIGYQLLEIRTLWAFELGARLTGEALAREPGLARLRYLQIRFAIALRRDDEALALIDALPPRFARPDFLELRAWGAERRGADAEAKAIWARALAGGYYAAIHAPIRILRRVSGDDRPPPGEGVTAYVVFRNEAPQIPAFLAHHRRLGVRRFVLIDHASDDGGRELALRESDCVVFECPDSYQLSWSGRRWVNEIVAEEGARGWGLQLDIDEHLIYPGCENVPIDRFVGYLDARGFEAVRGYMLDVFPPRLIGDDGEPAPLAEHVWLDADYTWFGLQRPPYLSPIGGVRARLFEGKEYLHKVPLWRLDAGRLVNSHETTALRFADVSAALAHYKLMNVALRGRERAGVEFLEPDADIEAIRRHARYNARLAPLWRADLRRPEASRRLEDSLTLTQWGLMEASDAYRRWLAAQ